MEDLQIIDLFRNRKSIYAKNIERFFLKISKMNLQT